MKQAPDITQDQETSRAVERDRRILDLRCECDGLDAAKAEAVAQIAAGVLWLDQHYGARRTFEFVSRIADELIAVDAR